MVNGAPGPGPDDPASDRPGPAAIDLVRRAPGTPVLVRSDDMAQRGLARLLSGRVLFIQLAELPPVGTRLEISFAGVSGSSDAPEGLVVRAEVRQHLGWTHPSPEAQPSVIAAIRVRILDRDEVATAPLTSWLWATGYTIH